MSHRRRNRHEETTAPHPDDPGIGMRAAHMGASCPYGQAFVTSGDVTNPLVSTAGATLPPEPVAVSNAADLQNSIADGKSVKLTDNITITSTLEIARSLTLDLNGYVLKMGGTGRVIHIIKSHGYDVKVEIKDGEPGKEHTGEYAALPAGGVITGGRLIKGEEYCLPVGAHLADWRLHYRPSCN